MKEELKKYYNSICPTERESKGCMEDDLRKLYILLLKHGSRIQNIKKLPCYYEIEIHKFNESDLRLGYLQNRWIFLRRYL